MTDIASPAAPRIAARRTRSTADRIRPTGAQARTPGSQTRTSSALYPIGTPIPWPRILAEARQHFGIERFRPGQREVLESVFRGHNTVALMPTGSGKSLTFQLPALLLPKPVLVVSPLIALMEDQQHRAENAGLEVDKFDSTLTRRQSEAAHADVAAHRAQLIYTTPERLENPAFLQELKAAGGISLLVVDEAHTIAQWGHDFRPAFLSIGEARRSLGQPPVLALTATATSDVVEEILQTLNAADATRINTGTERENLFFSVHPTVNNEAKLARIQSMLRQEDGTGIIYTASVRSANDLFDALKDAGHSVGHYHGQLGTRERERVQGEFMRGEHKVMIATKAFGLGIDKPDIRFVYHFEFPDSLESYYQEAGRAGRDGKPAHAVLLYRLEDKRIQSFFLAGRYPKPTEFEAVFQALRGRVLTEASTEIKASPQELTQSVVDAATVPVHPSVHHATSAFAGGVGPAVVAVMPSQVRHTSAPAPHSDAPDAAPPAVAPAPDHHHNGRPLVSALTIADETRIGRRRIQVILHLLKEARIIHRTHRGYALRAQHPPTPEQIAALLQTYSDRGDHDHARLSDMMHFAESPTCRIQLIRKHFDEPTGEPCRRCDNCARDQGAGLSQDLAGQTAAGVVPIIEASEPPAGTEHHERIHIVDTPTGSYQTTREVHTPSAPESAFRPGDQVLHKRFGPGKVLDIHDGNVLVAFPKEGHKRLRADFLQSA